MRSHSGFRALLIIGDGVGTIKSVYIQESPVRTESDIDFRLVRYPSFDHDEKTVDGIPDGTAELPMNGSLEAGAIWLDGDADHQLYQSNGVGRMATDGRLKVSWAEAAYLLERDELTSVDGMGFETFLSAPPDSLAIDRWLVYRDLRSRGYYLSTAYEPGESPTVTEVDFLVRPRGAAPTSDEVAHRMNVVNEATVVHLPSIVSMTLAVADDEGELTYIDIEPFTPRGSTSIDHWLPSKGRRVGQRVLVREPSDMMVSPGFFGSDLGESSILLNALEAWYLDEMDLLDVADCPSPEDEKQAVVYRALRDHGCVPRSGLKFGADFRVYTDVADASDPGHSSYLVEVVDGEATFTPRILSRAVRLAGGVRKRHVIAAVDGTELDWYEVERKRP